MDLKETGINMRNWIDMAWVRDYSRALEPVGSISQGVSNCPGNLKRITN